VFGQDDPVPGPTPIFFSDFRNSHDPAGLGLGATLLDLLMAQLMPLPLIVSCFSKIQIGFTFLAPAHPGSPGQRAVKRVCVCVAGVICLSVCDRTAFTCMVIGYN